MAIISRDSIKRRMIRNASRIWGYSDVQDVNSFDPMVKMLVETLADELFNLQNQLSDSEKRIADKLLDILFNRSGLLHSPAHALAEAIPSRLRVDIDEDYHFAIQSQISKKVGEETKYELKELVFTPTGTVTLLKGEITCIEIGGALFRTFGQDKELVGRASRVMAFDRTKISIGLTMNQKQTDLSGLLLYFQVKNNPAEDQFYSLLTTASWKANNEDISIQKGIDQGADDPCEGLSSLLIKENSKTYSSCQAINTVYENALFRVSSADAKISYSDQNSYIPANILKGYDEKVLKPFAKVTLWLEIYLEGAVSEELIEDFVVLMNCFPVINRKLHEASFSISKGLNILPLTTDDIFFDIKELTDSSGVAFKALESLENDQFNQEAYYLSQQGVARYNSQESHEMINQLINLVKNEGAAFAAIGRDLIVSEMHDLTQILNRLQQRLEANNTPNDSSVFVFLNTNRRNERAHLSYWSTTGEIANNIRAGSVLNIIKGIDLEPQVLFLSNTIGGKRKPSQDEKLNKLRVNLLSHGRILTNEDIKAFCFDFFGSELKSVRVTRGVKLDEKPGSGMVRCLDVHLLFHAQQTIPANDLNIRMRNIKVLLEKRTQMMVPIRVVME